MNKGSAKGLSERVLSVVLCVLTRAVRVARVYPNADNTGAYLRTRRVCDPIWEVARTYSVYRAVCSACFCRGLFRVGQCRAPREGLCPSRLPF